MTLFCPRHDFHTNVSCAKDFDKVREGGCSHLCGELLECGHNCQSLCHALDREHKGIPCREPCARLAPTNFQFDLEKCKVDNSFLLECAFERDTDVKNPAPKSVDDARKKSRGS